METYVVLQPAVAMRAEASDRSEMVSQMLFGEECELIERAEKWNRVRCCSDNYEGWVDNKQMALPSAEELEKLRSDSSIAKAVEVPLVMNGDCVLLLPMGSRVPNKELSICGHTFMPINGVGDAPLDWAAAAARLMGAPYLWGGKTLMGIDCSGLMEVAAKVVDKSIPRDASQQAELGEKVASMKDALRNDLCFFCNAEGCVIHVGIYLGDGEILHASGSVHVDMVDDKGIFNKEQNEYTHTLHSIRRIR